MKLVSSRNRASQDAARAVFFAMMIGFAIVGLINWTSMTSTDSETYTKGIFAFTNNEEGNPTGRIKPRHLKSSYTETTHQNPLSIPQGQAVALPSIRIEKNDLTRGQYGGEGDKAHLGGFTAFDGQGVSPAVWDHMITHTGVKSLMDVGCGKGVSTLYFATQGVDVLCLEGSHDAVTQTLLPDSKNQIVEHDFSRGPYWPGKTYDAVWSVEFLEHVGRNFQYNYMQSFRKAAYIFLSHSKWGGWHHVEVHDQEWWIQRMQMYGFQYSERMTWQIRGVARREHRYAEKHQNELLQSIGPSGKPYNAQHVWLNMIVFINPAVASLPEHAHLMAEPGCFDKRDRVGDEHVIINRECNDENETDLPESFKPLKLKPNARQIWLEKVRASIQNAQQK